MSTPGAVVTTTAIAAVEVSDCEIGMQAPRCGDILRCLGCGETWSLIMDGIVCGDRVTMTVGLVAHDQVAEIGAGVAWFSCDDCKRCRDTKCDGPDTPEPTK